VAIPIKRSQKGKGARAERKHEPEQPRRIRRKVCETGRYWEKRRGGGGRTLRSDSGASVSLKEGSIKEKKRVPFKK